jgi:uncharacterized protein (TIGR02611 family)
VRKDRGPDVETRPTDQEEPRRKWHHRARGRIRRNRTLDTTWRIVVFVVGIVFVVAGLVMFVAPGPGWLTVILGLAILSTEFSWAQRVLHWARRKAEDASAKALDPRVRKRNLLIALCVVVVIAAACWWWVAQFGWPQPLLATVDWLRSWR